MESNISMIAGDLFSCPSTHSMAHCISADCRMGKGIALMFKNKFGGILEIRAQHCRPGDVAVLRRGERFIYALVTKQKYSDKPTYDTLRRSLHVLKEHCAAHDVRHLVMPRIGCGLDRLSWDRVLAIIRSEFKDTAVKIDIYSL